MSVIQESEDVGYNGDSVFIYIDIDINLPPTAFKETLDDKLFRAREQALTAHARLHVQEY